MSSNNLVRIKHAALDEHEGDIILRGSIDPACLGNLLVDGYQREILPHSTIEAIKEGFERGSIPDVELSMRGHRVGEADGGTTYILRDQVYIVDGLQRVTAARQLIREGKVPRLGASIYFGKDREWEVERFRILNFERTKLSPNVFLRNMRDRFPAVATLYSLSEDDRDFPLRGRICWRQRPRREHLITARTFLVSVGFLHMDAVPGGNPDEIKKLSPRIQAVMDLVGRNVLRDNVRTFFDVVDQCWGIRGVTVAEEASHLKLTFLRCLAELFSSHEVFWRESRLFVEASLRRKLASFPMTRDPHLRQLAGSHGQGRKILSTMLLDHVNSGKRTGRLVRRNRTSDGPAEATTEQAVAKSA